jgi:hypothetical protein
MTTPVSFEIAKLLKEKGFNTPTLYFYLDGKLKYNHSIQPRNSNAHSGTIDVSAPNIAEIVMWLYEKHGIWIWSTPQIDLKGEFYWKWYAIKLSNMRPKSATSIIKHPMLRDMNSTPEKAYEAAIEHILKKIF